MTIKIPKLIVNPSKYRKAYFKPGEIYHLREIDFFEKTFDAGILPSNTADGAVFSSHAIKSVKSLRTRFGGGEPNFNGFYGYFGKWDKCPLLSGRFFDLFLSDAYIKNLNNYWEFETKILESDSLVFLDAISHSAKQRNQFGFPSPISLTTELKFYNIRTNKTFSVFPSIQTFTFENVSLEVKKKPHGK